MSKEIQDEKFLELESTFELSTKVFSKISGKQSAKSFWAYDEAMKRKLTATPALREGLLTMKFREGFVNYFEFQGMRRVLEKYKENHFVASEHPKWMMFLSGEQMTISNNVIHVKTDTAFLENSKGNLERAARALLETWVNIPGLSSPKSYALEHFVDLDSIRITYLRQPKNGDYTFSIVFDTKVKLTHDFDREWDSSLYKKPKPFHEYSRVKLLWDLLTNNEKFRVDGLGYMLYPCLVPESWENHLSWIDFSVDKNGRTFMGTIRLLSEFLTDGKLNRDIEIIDRFQKKKFLFETSEFFRRDIKEISRSNLKDKALSPQNVAFSLTFSIFYTIKGIGE